MTNTTKCPSKQYLGKRQGSGSSGRLVSRVLTGFLAVTIFPSFVASNASFNSLSELDCVVEPSLTIELAAAVPGLLAHSFFESGDRIQAGAVLARLENEVESVALAIARQTAETSTNIQLRELTAEFGDRTRHRNAKLRESVGVSEQEMDQVETEARIARLQVLQEKEMLRLAELDVQRAQALLDRRDIRSPIDGLITERYKSPGEYVDREPVFQISQLNPLQVEVIVPNEYMGSFQPGMQTLVTIQAPGFEGRPVQATIQRIDAVADPASATFGVRLLLDNEALDIPAGVRCSVDLPVS